MGTKLEVGFKFIGQESSASGYNFLLPSLSSTALLYEELSKLFFGCQSRGEGQPPAESCSDCECFIQLFKKHIETTHGHGDVVKRKTKLIETDINSRILEDQNIETVTRRLTRTSSRSTSKSTLEFKPRDSSPKEIKQVNKATHKFRLRVRRLSDIDLEAAGKCITPSSKRLKVDSVADLEQDEIEDCADANPISLIPPSCSSPSPPPVSGSQPSISPDVGDELPYENNENAVDNTRETDTDSERTDAESSKEENETKIILLCNICKIEFPDGGELLKHFESDHSGGVPEKPYGCGAPSCGKSFACLKYLKAHIQFVHTQAKRKKRIWRPPRQDQNNKARKSGKIWPCDPTVCNLTFLSARELQEHCRNDHNNDVKPHPCTICNKRFPRIADVTYHMRRHNGVKPHQCDECGKSFVVGTKLTLHKRIHLKEQERPCRCPHCEKKFVTNHDLDIHLRLHTGVRPYMCEFCSRDFRSTNSLAYHLKTHHGAKWIECEHEGCTMKFKLKAQLNNHAKIHTGSRTIMCADCGMTFSVRSKMNNHKCGDWTQKIYK